MYVCLLFIGKKMSRVRLRCKYYCYYIGSTVHYYFLFIYSDLPPAKRQLTSTALPHVITAVNNENLPPGTDLQLSSNKSTCANGCAMHLPVPAAGTLDCVGVGDWQPIAADTDDNFDLVDLMLEVEVAVEDEKSSIVNGIYFHQYY